MEKKSIIWRGVNTTQSGHVQEARLFEITQTKQDDQDDYHSSRRRKNKESDSYELRLDNIMQNAFGMYDRCDFSSLKDAQNEAERLLEMLIKKFSTPLDFKKNDAENGYYVSIDEAQIGEIKCRDEDRGRGRETKYVIYFEVSLDNSFRSLFGEYDRCIFDTIEEAQSEFSRLQNKFVAYFKNSH